MSMEQQFDIGGLDTAGADIAALRAALESVSSPLARMPLRSLIASLDGALALDGPVPIAPGSAGDTPGWF